MKYKVGDKVKVRRDLKLGLFENYYGVNEEMTRIRGNILTVRTTMEPHGYKVIENPWSWSDDMLEPADSGTFPSFPEIVDSMGIKEGDRVLINGHELTFTGKAFVDKSGKRANTKILGSDFKILPKPKTGAEILARLKELRGDWEPDWEDEAKFCLAYTHLCNDWVMETVVKREALGALFFSEETVKKAVEYLNTLTEEESLNLLKEMRI